MFIASSVIKGYSLCYSIVRGNYLSYSNSIIGALSLSSSPYNLSSRGCLSFRSYMCLK